MKARQKQEVAAVLEKAPRRHRDPTLSEPPLVRRPICDDEEADRHERLYGLLFRVIAAGTSAELARVAGNCISALLRIALDGEQDASAKQDAGEFLAELRISLDKHHERLSRSNARYSEVEKRMRKLRIDMLFPTKPSVQIVRAEFQKVSNYRWRLRLIRSTCGKTWREKAHKNGIPEQYLAAAKLPDFGVRSESKWWKFLWPLVQSQIDVSQLQPLKQHDDGSKGGIKDRRRYASDSWNECRGHLRSLARLVDSEVLSL